MGVNDSAFIKACYGKNDGRIPIWIMRQAGRYLPEYRAIREKVSFQELCRSPELIAEVVRQPVHRFGLDAAILFSDILTMLEPMGIKVDFPEGGPSLENPITSPEDVNRLTDFDVEKELAFVLEGIRQIKKLLPETPLIGFTGSPFTLACYLIEGQGSKNFDSAKIFINRHPGAAQKMFELLSDIITRYLKAQVNAGADAVQVFDSWGGILSHDDYRQWSAVPVQKIFKALESDHVPRVLYVNNIAPYLDIVSDMDCEVIGVDYRLELKRAAEALNGKSLQGNLDPSLLFNTPERIKESTRKTLDSIENHDRLIFNLGHGIQPEAPVESVEAMIETVHSYRNER